MIATWTAALGAPALAAGFVVGCAAIHAMRRHADRLTVLLATVALCLGAVVALMAVSGEPAASTPDAVDPPACYGFG